MAPPRKKTITPPNIAPKTLILDNGAFNIKAGLVAHSDDHPDVNACVVVPNCIARDRTKKTWLASQLEQCNDFAEMAFRRPVEKGFITNWEAERAVWWGGVFGKGAKLECDPKDTNLILTEAPNCPHVLQTACDEIVFEEFEFASYSRSLASSLIARSSSANPNPTAIGVAAPYCLVIDSGYSHTTITPLIHGQPIQSAVRRLTVGGKFLTNTLRELISLRHFNVLDEPWLVNEIKEATCYVSQNFRSDVEKTWKGGRNDGRAVDSSMLVEYVLPDFQTRFRGEARAFDPIAAAVARRRSGAGGEVREPTVTLGNERFSVPELLFSPSDVGMREAGLPELIMQSLDTLPEGLRGEMLANVVVVGGNARIPGFRERLESELQQLVLTEFTLRLTCSDDPTKTAYMGGANLASNRELLQQTLVTRQMYQEHGAQWVLRRFAGQ